MSDKKKAREWYERGAALGSTDAKSALDRMNGGAPATPEELQELDESH